MLKLQVKHNNALIKNGKINKHISGPFVSDESFIEKHIPLK